MAADITPYIKQLKKRPMQTIAVLKKGNWKLTHESSYKMKDSFRDMEIEGGKKSRERSRGWAGFSIHAFDGIPWGSASMNRPITKH